MTSGLFLQIIEDKEIHYASKNLRGANDVGHFGRDRGLQHGSRPGARHRAGGRKDSGRGGPREEKNVVRIWTSFLSIIVLV